MNSINEEDEFVAVRVQDPRVQNEGSWNSFVDFKIFLHTNSKAFTAKTSCVRRRYSEFVWLRKKMQKNAGLVPVPDLPGKSFFSFSNEEFLEKRRKGLQAFLEKVVHTTVCLSDSQLHLFLQTQLPIGHILDCVQGHTPYSVTDAILTYASSNRGLAQAQEDDSLKDCSLTVSYESMESPAPHPPCVPSNEVFSPALLSCDDADPPEGSVELQHYHDGLRSQDGPSVRISQRSDHLQAVLEEQRPPQASFYLGGSLDDSQSPAGSYRVTTPALVHSPEDESGAASDSEEKEATRSGATLAEDLAFKDDQEEEETRGNGHVELILEHGVVSETQTTADDAESCTKDETLQPEAASGVNGLQEDQVCVSDEDGTSQSPPSSTGSIVKVSDDEEESACEEAELSLHATDRYARPPLVNDAGWPDAAQLNGSSGSFNLADGDLTENSDISILESSSAPGLAERKYTEEQAALSLDETQEVEQIRTYTH